MDVIDQNNVFYGREDGTYSLWDHPHFFSEKNIPQNFKPYFSLTNVLEDYYSWDDERRENYLTILVVVAQGICCTEEQIRRYFEIKNISRSFTGGGLTFLRSRGYLERYRVGIEDVELDVEDEERYQLVKTPGPIHIGIAGTLLLQYLYPRMALMKAEGWLNHTRNAMVQRYVAMNEIRLRFAELGIARDWKWHANYRRLDNERMSLKKPLAMMEIGDKNDKNNRAWLIFERMQSAQNFIGYIKDRLSRLESLQMTYGTLPFANTTVDGEKIVIISCATVAIANEIQETLGLQRYSFKVWVMVDEWFDQEDTSESILAAIAAPTLNEDGASYSLTRLQVSL